MWNKRVRKCLLKPNVPVKVDFFISKSIKKCFEKQNYFMWHSVESVTYYLNGPSQKKKKWIEYIREREKREKKKVCPKRSAKKDIND